MKRLSFITQFKTEMTVWFILSITPDDLYKLLNLNSQQQPLLFSKNIQKLAKELT